MQSPRTVRNTRIKKNQQAAGGKKKKKEKGKKVKWGDVKRLENGNEAKENHCIFDGNNLHNPFQVPSAETSQSERPVQTSTTIQADQLEKKLDSNSNKKEVAKIDQCVHIKPSPAKAAEKDSTSRIDNEQEKSNQSNSTMTQCQEIHKSSEMFEKNGHLAIQSDKHNTMTCLNSLKDSTMCLQPKNIRKPNIPRKSNKLCIQTNQTNNSNGHKPPKGIDTSAPTKKTNRSINTNTLRNISSYLQREEGSTKACQSSRTDKSVNPESDSHSRSSNELNADIPLKSNQTSSHYDATTSTPHEKIANTLTSGSKTSKVRTAISKRPFSPTEQGLSDIPNKSLRTNQITSSGIPRYVSSVPRKATAASITALFPL
jgi:hypothetical protein